MYDKIHYVFVKSYSTNKGNYSKMQMYGYSSASFHSTFIIQAHIQL